MWTLAHAHGTLLSLVHIAFGFTARTLPETRALPVARAREQRLASKSLVAASFLLPGGFFLGGITIYSEHFLAV
jgi:hypothetical protein